MLQYRSYLRFIQSCHRLQCSFKPQFLLRQLWNDKIWQCSYKLWELFQQMIRRLCGTRRGLHIFSCSVMATNTNHITVGFMKNGHFILKVSSTHGAFENGSRTVVLTMNKGDSVWVRRLAHNLSILTHYNSFSGYLYSTET